MDHDIEAAIPHRPPFLLVDEIVELHPDRLVARTTLRPDDELWSRIYAGHYPGTPITPGVLLLEMLFQAAGVLIAGANRNGVSAGGVPAVTRINNVKFKRMVFPGDSVELKVRIAEKLASAYYLKGEVLKDGKVSAQAEFALTAAAVSGRSSGTAI